MKLETLRHSSSHILASAVKSLYPKVKLGIGPAIEDGFYYDFDNIKFSEEDLTKIENKMKEIIKKDLLFKKTEVEYKKAKEMLKTEPYKLELLEELKGEKITFYQMGDFIDLCKGPHVKSTKEVKAVKLLKIAGAYWRGDENKPMLQRIYGISFPSEKELDEYINLRKKAEESSHLKLGKELDLFILSPIVGSGLPLITPKGTIIREELQKFLRQEQLKKGYLPVTTPHIGKIDLYKQSGHYPYYKETMFEPIKCENTQYILKPMNCPHHIQIYKSQFRSYRDLPLRLTEFGTVYRYEKSGELQGLTRVRMITQDDAHIFCLEEQVKDEILGVLDLVLYIFKILKFTNYRARFGTKDKSDKYIGSEDLWKKAEKDIESALKQKGINYIKEIGEAAFYGPKIDFVVKDVLGREWQLGTIQVDYNLPERFELSYEGSDGKKHIPIMIHRAPFGSLERFMGILIEHFSGKFPLWLSPVQVKILTLTDRNIPFAKKLMEKLKENNIRAELDEKPDTMNKKVRDAQLEKVNLIVTIGDKEEQNNSVAIRTREGKVTFGTKIDKFIENLLKEINEKS